MNISLKNIKQKSALIFVFSLLISLAFFAAPKAKAATYTVCASGCDFTTITDAFANPGILIGDTVTVGASYDPTGETYPLNFPITAPDITLDCQSSGATIDASGAMGTFNTYGQGVINMHLGSAVENCNLDNVELSQVQDGATIAGNTFSTANPTSITLSSDILTAATNFSIIDNTDITRIEIGLGLGATSAPNTGTISGNTITPYFALNSGFGLQIGGDATYHPSDIDITDNIISNHAAWGGGGGNLALVNVDNADDITFTGNTIDSPVDTLCDHCGTIQIGSGSNISFYNNYISQLDFSSADQRALRYQPSGSVTGTVEHNTFTCPANATSCVTFELFGANPGDSVDVSLYYNLFYNFAAAPAGDAIRLSEGAGATVDMPNDYNGFWNFSTNLSAGSTGEAIGPHHEVRNPVLMLDDADTSNDLHPAPFSPYFDVNGAQDIGAFGDTVISPNNNPRRSTMYVDDTGTIDYLTVDALSVDNTIAHSIRTGDTIEIAAGTYPAFSIIDVVDLFPANTITDASGGITVNGAGPGTIIDVTGSEDGITVQDMDNTIVRNLVVQNADTISTLYTATKALWVYAGNTYDDSDNLGAPPDSAFLVESGTGCDVISIASDGTDVTVAAGAAADDWHVGLVDVGGFKVTIYTPDRFNQTSGDLSTYLSANCGAPNTIDQFIPSIFTANGDGTFSFNAGAVSAASATLKPGETDPPRIDRSISGFAGLKFVNVVTNSTVDNITSTGNSYGIWFSGDSAGNIVTNSDLSGNNLNDIKSDATGDNDLKNVIFDRTTSDITGAGDVNVWFKARAYVEDSSNSPAAGASVIFEDNFGTPQPPLVTDGAGFTPYTDNLLAYIMTSSSISETNGGYNPYTATATSAGETGETTQNLNTPNQTYDVTLGTSTTGGTSGGGGGGGTTSTGGTAINPSTGLPLGCTSPYGYSPTTGRACSNPPITSPASLPQTCPAPQVFYRNLRIGMDGSDVLILQKTLNRSADTQVALEGAGSPGNETMHFGLLTEIAVKKFQVKYAAEILDPVGLDHANPRPSGYVAKYTRAKLESILSGCPLVIYPPSVTQARYFFTRDLRLNSTGADVRELQKFLNSRGFILASSGPGSPGHETQFFGKMTYLALIKFQEAYRTQILTPLHLTKGTGYFGPSTRAFVNSLLSQ